MRRSSESHHGYPEVYADQSVSYGLVGGQVCAERLDMGTRRDNTRLLVSEESTWR